MDNTIWFYPIDWEVTGIWMQAWAGFAGAFAVLFAAYTGKATLTYWLDQRRAERQLDLAESIQSLAHRAKTAFAAIRQPLHMAEELEAANEVLVASYPGYLGKPDDDKSKLKTSQVIFSRHNRFEELWKSLDEVLAPADAFFPNEVVVSLEKLIGLRRKILTSARMYANLNVRRTQPQMDQIEATIWDGYADNDPIADSIAEYIDTIKQHTSPILKGTTGSNSQLRLLRWLRSKRKAG